MDWYEKEIIKGWIDDLVEYYSDNYSKEEIEDSFWEDVDNLCNNKISGLSYEQCLDKIAEHQFWYWEDLQKEGLGISNFKQLLYFMYNNEVTEYYDEILSGVFERLGLDN